MHNIPYTFMLTCREHWYPPVPYEAKRQNEFIKKLPANKNRAKSLKEKRKAIR